MKCVVRVPIRRSPPAGALRVTGLPDRGPISNPPAVGTKSERRAARELVAGYHESQLAGLLEHVADAIDAHRAGTLDVHDVDEVIHHYYRAAQELWKFCWSSGVGAHIEIVARMIHEPIDDDDPVDWWQHGAPRKRGGLLSRRSALERSTAARASVPAEPEIDRRCWPLAVGLGPGKGRAFPDVLASRACVVTADVVIAVSGRGCDTMRQHHATVAVPGHTASEKMNDVQVFLSHASADKPLAETVRTQLKECGFTVWSDEPSRPGDSIAELIVSGINSSDAFVVILGKSTPSRQWTSLEIGGAVASGRPIVPVLAHRDASVPFLLRDLQYLDLSDPAARREQLPRLCDVLRDQPHRLGAGSGRRLIEDASGALRTETFVYEQALAASERSDRRSQLVAALLSVIAVAVALVTVSSDVTSVVSALVAGLSALVASMVGFYFGAERKRGGRD